MSASQGEREVEREDRVSPHLNHSHPHLYPNYHQNKQDGYQEITNDFLAAARCLEIGELVQAPHFSLFEAVGALEIMDPKMDSGLLKEITYDVLKPRLPSEIIGIMDQILCHEAAWHTGGALSQTLFTSVYLENLLSSSPKTIEEAVFSKTKKDKYTAPEAMLHIVLRGYLLAVAKTCSIVIGQIRQENSRSVPQMQDPYFIVEEEDLVMQTYNVTLLEDIPSEAIIQALDEGLEWIEKYKQAFKADVQTALMSRLMLRKHLLKAISTNPDSYSEAGLPSESWDACTLQLGLVDSTHSAGEAVPDAFTTDVQRKLASTVPPRPMVNLEFSEAVKVFQAMFRDGKDALTLLEGDRGDGLNILSFISQFSARNPQPLAFIRSLTRSILFTKGQVQGRHGPDEIVIQDFKDTVFPNPSILDPKNQAVENPQHPGFMIRERLDWFTKRASALYYQLFTMFLQNRSRMRRNLCHAATDWDQFQIDTEKVDNEIAHFTGEEGLKLGDQSIFAFPLSSWIYHYKLRIMETIVLLGFELDIYQPWEYGGMFWITQMYCRTRISHLERIRDFAISQKPLPTFNQAELKTWKNERIASLGLLNYTLLSGTALQGLCSSLQSLYAVLTQLGLIKTVVFPYGSDELRYEARMKPFMHIVCPDMVPFEETPPWHFGPAAFKGELDEPMEWAQELLEQASQAVKDARSDFEMLIKIDPTVSRSLLCKEEFKTDLKACLRSCIGASVAIAMLSKAVQKGTVEGLEVKIEKEKYHRFFPVPTVGPKK